jgi:hypothetical protein
MLLFWYNAQLNIIHVDWNNIINGILVHLKTCCILKLMAMVLAVVQHVLKCKIIISYHI